MIAAAASSFITRRIPQRWLELLIEALDAEVAMISYGGQTRSHISGMRLVRSARDLCPTYTCGAMLRAD